MSECSEWDPLDFQCPYACRYCPERNHEIRPHLTRDWRIIPRSHYGVWVASKTDMFHPAVPKRMISKILRRADGVSLDSHRFVFDSRNPARFAEFIPGSRAMSEGLLVTTVESDIDYGMTRASPPQERLNEMKRIHDKFPDQHICLAVQPIMKFTEGFADAIRAVGFREVSINREAVGFPGFPTPDIVDVMRLAIKLVASCQVLVGGENIRTWSRFTTWPPIKAKISNREKLLEEWDERGSLPDVEY